MDKSVQLFVFFCLAFSLWLFVFSNFVFFVVSAVKSILRINGSLYSPAQQPKPQSSQRIRHKVHKGYFSEIGL